MTHSAGQVIVAGLVMRMIIGGAARDECRPLAGPSVTAAAGVALQGIGAQLLAAIPSTSTAADLDVIRRLDPAGRLLHRLPLPPLMWTGPKIVGHLGIWHVDGDPTLWRATCPAEELANGVLVLANGDPGWYAKLLADSKPRFVAVDIDAQWATVRFREIQACLGRAHLVTITEHDLHILPPEVLRGTRAGQIGGAILVEKRGPDGLTIHIDGIQHDLPAPADPSGVRTDVGAGDLLLGALAAQTAAQVMDGRCRWNAIRDAYGEARLTVAALLGANDLIEFLSESIQPATETALRPT